jgi:hypothetical protein
MDTMTATTAVERAASLRSKLESLHEKRRETDSALAREHALQSDLTAKRGKLTEELNGADEATEAFLHNEIDGLDESLRFSSRLSEGLSNALPRIVSEITALGEEFAEVQRQIGLASRAKALEDFQKKLKEASDSAENHLAQTRESLALLNRIAANGVEQFGFQGQRTCEEIFASFFDKQSNLGRDGWNLATPSYTNLQFLIRPMKRG